VEDRTARASQLRERAAQFRAEAETMVDKHLAATYRRLAEALDALADAREHREKRRADRRE
jgi:hypothetical protein